MRFNINIPVLICFGCQTALASPCISSSIQVTHGSTDSYDYGQGSGCITRPIQDVWAVLKTSQGMSFDGSTLVSSSPRSELAPGVQFSYQNEYQAGGLFSVSWVMQWDDTVKVGTADQPQSVEVHYSKVDGTSFIGYWEGDIDLQSTGPSSVSVTIKNQIQATQTDENDAASTVQQIFDRLR